MNNIEVGCQRRDQCSKNPCHSGGQCTDLWKTFSCTCQRPYLGNQCQYSEYFFPPSSGQIFNFIDGSLMVILVFLLQNSRTIFRCMMPSSHTFFLRFIPPKSVTCFCQVWVLFFSFSTCFNLALAQKYLHIYAFFKLIDLLLWFLRGLHLKFYFFLWVPISLHTCSLSGWFKMHWSMDHRALLCTSHWVTF